MSPEPLTRLQADPEREILLIEQPLFPSARLAHLLRWLALREQLPLEVLIEEDAFHVVHADTAGPLLAGRLVHVPDGLFPEGSELRERLRLAGVRFNYLPPLPARPAHHHGPSVQGWETLLKPVAFSAWLAAGTQEPWTKAGSRPTAHPTHRAPATPSRRPGRRLFYPLTRRSR